MTESSDPVSDPGAAGDEPREGGRAPDRDAPRLVGTTLAGRYRIVDLLGEGAMGAVYLGEHLRMGRLDAIKVLSPAMARDPDALARFTREARNASFIKHPNACGVYDFGETDDGLAFLAMEYVEGERLTDLLAREQVLDPSRAMDLVSQVVDALEAAHARGIVHRDLKPDNIMITQAHDGSEMVKVVDFGIAKAVGDEQAQDLTRTGLVIGTPEYMSPEQLTGDPVDGRSDIYSLAIVLFRMVTGGLPFEGDTARELMVQRLTGEPRRLSEVRPDLSFPPGLQGTLDRALRKKPEDRYESARAFRAALYGDGPATDREEPWTRDTGAGVGTDREEGERLGPEPAASPEGGGAVPATRISGSPPPSTGDAGDGLHRRVRMLAPWIGGGIVLAAVLATGVILIGDGSGSDPAGASGADVRPPVAEEGEGPGSGGDPGPNEAGPTAVDTGSDDRQTGERAAGDRGGETAETTPPTDPPVSAQPSDREFEDNLLDRQLPAASEGTSLRREAALDTATMIYGSAGSARVRALAAFVAASALAEGGDTLRAIEWAERATRLAPDAPQYSRYLSVLRGSR